MKSQTISEIRKQFVHEWLLIAVDEMDERATVPISGRLIAHSADPLEIHKAAQQSRESLLMTEYSDDWPADLAACFYANFFPEAVWPRCQ